MKRPPRGPPDACLAELRRGEPRSSCDSFPEVQETQNLEVAVCDRLSWVDQKFGDRAEVLQASPEEVGEALRRSRSGRVSPSSGRGQPPLSTIPRVGRSPDRCPMGSRSPGLAATETRPEFSGESWRVQTGDRDGVHCGGRSRRQPSLSRTPELPLAGDHPGLRSPILLGEEGLGLRGLPAPRSMDAASSPILRPP